MFNSRSWVILAAAMLAACSGGSPADDSEADDSGDFSSRQLPATVVGIIDMSLGEGAETEDGGEMLFGSLQVGEEDLYIQADAEMLESSGIEQEPVKVRATIQSKEDLGSGIIHYKVISVDKM